MYAYYCRKWTVNVALIVVLIDIYNRAPLPASADVLCYSPLLRAYQRCSSMTSRWRATAAWKLESRLPCYPPTPLMTPILPNPPRKLDCSLFKSVCSITSWPWLTDCVTSQIKSGAVGFCSCVVCEFTPRTSHQITSNGYYTCSRVAQTSLTTLSPPP